MNEQKTRGTMSKKRVSLSNRYKRFFISERTALISAVMSVLILPVIYYFGTRSGGINLAGTYDLLMRLALITTLFWSLKKHKLFLMQAATVGLLFCMLCAQSQYALGDLATHDVCDSLAAEWIGHRGKHADRLVEHYRPFALGGGEASSIDGNRGGRRIHSRARLLDDDAVDGNAA